MAKLLTKLTPEQEARIPAIRDEFLRIGLSTEPADFDAAEQAARDAYAVAGLPAPELFIRLASPMEGAIGAAILKGNRIGGSVWAQVWAQVGDQVGVAFYSQHEAGWLSWASYFHRVCNLPGAEKIEPLARIAANCGWVWFFAGAVIITDRPRILRRDDQNRLHCEDGPALEYRDGFAIHAWHGTRIPAEWVEDRASLTAKIALTWPNVDQRAAACEILGWHNIINSMNARIIDADDDPQIGRLVEIDLPDHGPQKFIHARCGTGREIAVMADARATTILEAQAASYGLSASDFIIPEIRT